MSNLTTLMALLRGLHVAAMLSLLGSAGFIAWMLPAAGAVTPASLRRSLVQLSRGSGLLAVLTGAAWLVLQAAIFVDADNLADGLAALPVVAAHTRFGNILLARLGLLVIATLLLPATATAEPRGTGGVRVHIVLLLTVIALGLQGFIGHAGATGGAIGDSLVLSEALHLLAAGLWLGGLIPLWLSLRALPPAQAAIVCERFSPVGLGCVLVLAGTGFAQALQLAGTLPALLGTTYGRLLLLKIALFLAALILAAINRLWLTDRLTSQTNNARRHLLISVSLETLLGIAIVAAAGFLASSVPAAHSVPVWPLSWQFSLVTINEDADFRREVILSLLTIGGTLVLLVAAMLRRRFRPAALAIFAVTVVQWAPSLRLLTVAAYPTSFQTSPTGFSAISIARGEALFARNCVACHGPEAEGNGPAAAGLPIKPTDLTMPHVQEHTDGDMFWWLSHGIDNPRGGLAMPGFASSLSADDRWALIDYVRAHNAGVAMERDPAFDVPVRDPGFAVACDGVAASITSDLRGRVLHVVIGEAAKDQLPVPPLDGISTVTLVVPSEETENTGSAPGACVAADASAWNAYAILADLPLDEVAGTEFLIDPNGWLRAVRRPGTTAGWHAGGELLAAIHEICAHPIEQPTGGQHDHHH
jgi:putative copper export protein/mono/diheme cytochrome c family protein